MRRVLLLVAVVVASGCAGGRPPAPQVEFWAGVAAVDITPEKSVPLGGYGGRQGKPMTGVHDPIYAKALWLETAHARICLVTTDLIGSTVAIRDRIRPDDAQVVMAASHTHSGPGAIAPGFWELAMGKFDPEFLETMVAKLKGVVEQARDARRPARLAFARTSAPEFNRNRRSKEGPTDPELQVMLVTDGLTRPMAVVVNYTAHGTQVSEKSFLVSGDWPGALQRSLEERFPTALAFYTNGAEGDIAPRSPGGRDDFEKCAAMGEALAGRVAILVSSIEKTAGEVRISYVERGVELPSPTLPVAPKSSVLGLLEINGTRMFCFPGEPAVELGLELKRSFPGSWILGLANDHLGYFLTEPEYLKGGYERMVSFYGPKMGPWLVAQLTEMAAPPEQPAQDRAK